MYDLLKSSKELLQSNISSRQTVPSKFRTVIISKSKKIEK